MVCMDGMTTQITILLLEKTKVLKLKENDNIYMYKC